MSGGGRAHTVLVVDDDAVIRAVVHEVLQAEGYRVAGAATVEQALDALTHTRFGLVLADARLAGGGQRPTDRWAVLERLRAAAGSTPVVIFTAAGQQEFADYRARGFADLVLKPFDLDDLVTTVARHTGSARDEASPGHDR